ncbi:proton-conducting transporter membrane subunit [Flagellimonas okinawensis]|uniref:Proton-conducting transporter membrane subunit n=1 Tax=Flagellimonas okinawensis TaxID=3031324 RepID=A0ABT5XQH2_9FLAO|nr:proton-conducting transporter membrane subunit [[Muricauda] okinawensis]MDF0707846.1 proton-conducting transporter membrane subunit [[Muricauda] okinawensis]
MTQIATILIPPSKRNKATGLTPVLFWLVFISQLVFGAAYFPEIPEWKFWGLFRVNGFTLLISTVVTFFCAIISTYANSYFKRERQRSKFMLLCIAFTSAVLLFLISDHLVPLLLGWFMMGFVMASLIGLDTSWGEAREARLLAQQYFLASGVSLSFGLLLLAAYHNVITLSDLMASVDQTPYFLVLITALFIIIAALIQSAIFPFHKWLLSSMTAPTPASALMHAGFVNGSGILLTLLAAIIIESQTMNILFVIGGLTAIVAQFAKLIQVNVKQRLACSTIAQMGFMIMQCGLGFFNAAIAHLILHGFYKAYLFLSSGEGVKQSTPLQPPVIRIKALDALIVLLYSILGAFLFARFTGKGMDWDSGIFLTLIASIAVGQATYNIVKQHLFTGIQKIVLPPILFVAGIGAYALMYKWVSTFMVGMEVVAVPSRVSPLQLGFGLIFLVGFFLMKLGVYRQIPWLYIKLMNISQPNKRTILMYKTNMQ